MGPLPAIVTACALVLSASSWIAALPSAYAAPKRKAKTLERKSPAPQKKKAAAPTQKTAPSSAPMKPYRPPSAPPPSAPSPSAQPLPVVRRRAAPPSGWLKQAPSPWAFRLSPSLGWSSFERAGALTETATSQTGRWVSSRNGPFLAVDLGTVYSEALELGGEVRALATLGEAAGTTENQSYSEAQSWALQMQGALHVRWYPQPSFAIGVLGGALLDFSRAPTGNSAVSAGEPGGLPLFVGAELRWLFWKVATRLQFAYSPQWSSAFWLLGGGWEF